MRVDPAVAVRAGTEKLQRKAERAVRAAQAALAAGAPDVAAGRAFAAILSAAKARVNEHGQRVHTHVRLAAAYAALPVLAAAPAQALTDALTLRRQLADEPDGLSYDEVARLVDTAETFVGAALSGATGA